MSAIQSFLKSMQQQMASFYLVHGEEDLLRIEALDALRVAAKKHGFNQKDQFYVESQHFDWSLLVDAAQSMGLFSDKKLIEIHVPNGKVGKEGGAILQNLLQFASSDIVMVLLMPKLEKTQQNSAWFKAWQSQAQLLEAKAVSSAQLPDWIRQRLREGDLGIDDDALGVFADKVEGNLLAAKQEVDKLSLLFPQGSQLDLATIESVIANVARFDTFQLASAWMSGNQALVYRLTEGLQQTGEEPVLPLWAVSEDIRTLIRLKAGMANNTPQRELIQSLRLWGNKQQPAFAAAKRLSVTMLMTSLAQCALIDCQIKGAATGEAWRSLQDLLMELSA